MTKKDPMEVMIGMEIVSGYRNNEILRKSFTGLAKSVFGIDLETWYRNGFWQDDYIPYSVVEDGRIVSNISVNVCNFRVRSRIRHLAQIGTVMTDNDHRNRGYMNALMEKVLDHCDRSFEGTYLFAEDKMASFYEKYGFRRADEYSYRKKVNITNTRNVENIPMDSPDEWSRMVDIIQRREQYGQRVMVNNPGLFMFYLSDSLSECVYYVPACDAYAVAGEKEDILKIYAIFSSEKASLGDVISAFGNRIRHVKLAFTPENNTGFEIRKIEDPDTVLFVRGKEFDNTGNERFMFPEISHA